MIRSKWCLDRNVLFEVIADGYVVAVFAQHLWREVRLFPTQHDAVVAFETIGHSMYAWERGKGHRAGGFMRRTPGACCRVVEYGWVEGDTILWFPFNVWWPEGPDEYVHVDGKRYINNGPYRDPDWERLECGVEKRVPVRGTRYYNRSRRCFIPAVSA